MTTLNVRHTTVYRYRRPVRLGDHRLMLRPRDSHDLRLIRTNLNFLPAVSVRWLHDVFGNRTPSTPSLRSWRPRSFRCRWGRQPGRSAHYAGNRRVL